MITAFASPDNEVAIEVAAASGVSDIAISQTLNQAVRQDGGISNGAIEVADIKRITIGTAINIQLTINTVKRTLCRLAINQIAIGIRGDINRIFTSGSIDVGDGSTVSRLDINNVVAATQVDSQLV